MSGLKRVVFLKFKVCIAVIVSPKTPNEITLDDFQPWETVRLEPCKARQCNHTKCVTGRFWEGVSANIARPLIKTPSKLSGLQLCQPKTKDLNNYRHIAIARLPWRPAHLCHPAPIRFSEIDIRPA